MPGPNIPPPRSDRVDAAELDDAPGESSSKDTQVDLSPPPGEDKAGSSDETMAADGDVMEMHPFNPHKAAKDLEVGDFYFKRKNYIGAEGRYREALYYKQNDALATFKLAQCLEKMGRPEEAQAEFETYLKILPNGPEAPEAKKALEKLKSRPESAKPAR